MLTMWTGGVDAPPSYMVPSRQRDEAARADGQRARVAAVGAGHPRRGDAGDGAGGDRSDGDARAGRRHAVHRDASRDLPRRHGLQEILERDRVAAAAVADAEVADVRLCCRRPAR